MLREDLAIGNLLYEMIGKAYCVKQEDKEHDRRQGRNSKTGKKIRRKIKSKVKSCQNCYNQNFTFGAFRAG